MVAVLSCVIIAMFIGLLCCVKDEAVGPVMILGIMVIGISIAIGIIHNDKSHQKDLALNEYGYYDVNVVLGSPQFKLYTHEEIASNVLKRVEVP